MDEYDPPTPISATKAYCARLNLEDYENESSVYTENALDDLIQYLEKNPASYQRVMIQRKKEEQENSGVLSYAKVKYLMNPSE